MWVLPDYIDDIDYVAEFNDKNFSSFLRDYFGHKYVPESKKNASANKGFKYYFENGDISEEAKDLIESDAEYLKYKSYLDG